jgi:hypothetical protein
MNPSSRAQRLLVGLLFLAVFGSYVGGYWFLSRRGYQEADQFGLKGFYYITYEDTDSWRRTNQFCTILFWPLNRVDRLLGTGSGIGNEPCMLR